MIQMEICQRRMDTDKSNCMWKSVKWIRRQVIMIIAVCDGHNSPNSNINSVKCTLNNNSSSNRRHANRLNVCSSNSNNIRTNRSYRIAVVNRHRAFTRTIIAKIPAIRIWFMHHRRRIAALLATWAQINASMKCRCIFKFSAPMAARQTGWTKSVKANDSTRDRQCTRKLCVKFKIDAILYIFCQHALSASIPATILVINIIWKKRNEWTWNDEFWTKKWNYYLKSKWNTKIILEKAKNLIINFVVVFVEQNDL